MPQLTEMDVIKMREMLAQHDAEQDPIRVIDLNNPPRQPYKYQKFPKIVYDLESSTEQKIAYVVVEDEESLQAYLEAGWSEQPPSFSEIREEDLKPAYQMEANQVEEKLEEARQKRAYVRKAS